MAGKPGGKPRSSASAGPTRQHVKGENFYRDAKKAKRVLLLSGKTSKAIRDAKGNIVKEAAFQSTDATPGRVQPDRRWFGNTRVISQKALDHFRTSLAEKAADPFQVVIRPNRLPMSLLESDAAKAARGGKGMKVDLVSAEPWSETFGPRQRRKRPKLGAAGTFEELVQQAEEQGKEGKRKTMLSGQGLPMIDGMGQALNGAEEGDVEMDEAFLADAKLTDVPTDYILSAGTSKRIWAELYKVIDSSDVILHVLDARDPLGTRCESVEKYLAKEKRAKKMVFILNKVDLVPGWVAVSRLPFFSLSLFLSLSCLCGPTPVRLLRARPRGALRICGMTVTGVGEQSLLLRKWTP